MTSAKEGKAVPALPQPGAAEERRRSPLDLLPPPANSSKPLTPFSIEDILSKPSGHRAPAARLLEKVAGSAGPPRNGVPAPDSPLCALEELASKTFQGLELNVLQAAEGKGRLTTGRGAGRAGAGQAASPAPCSLCGNPGVARCKEAGGPEGSGAASTFQRSGRPHRGSDRCGEEASGVRPSSH